MTASLGIKVVHTSKELVFWWLLRYHSIPWKSLPGFSVRLKLNVLEYSWCAIVLVSGVQQNDSVIHILIATLFKILFPIDHYRLLSSLCCIVGPY